MKKIPFNEIPLYLMKHESIDIFGGKIVIKRKLQSIIGGIPVYSFEVCRITEEDRPVTIQTLDELNDYTTINQDGLIPRCIECDCLPVESGYYYDNTLDVCICDYECLIKYMNKVFGKGRWSVEHDKKNNKSTFFVNEKEYDIEYKKLENNDDEIIFYTVNDLDIT